MPTITINRPYEPMNQASYIDVYINDQEVGDIRIDEAFKIEVSPEKHKIVLKQKYAGGSKPFIVDLSNNEDVTLKMKTFKYGWLGVAIIVILARVIINILPETFTFLENLLGYLVVTLLLTLLLFKPFFRARYIKLEKDHEL